VPFNPTEEDVSVLWTEGKDVGKGFRCISMVNNTRLGFDAFHGDKDHGGVHDGTTVVLWEWCKGENQSWKILPWGPEALSPAAGPGNASIGGVPVHTVRVFCKAGGGDYSLTARNGAVCLAPSNPRDEYQHWIKDMRHSTRVRDEEGYPAFALVNKVTGEAIKHSTGQGHPVRLVPYDPEYQDESVLWTESRDVGDGFRCVRMVNNIYLNFDAFHGDKAHGGVHDGTEVVLWEWAKGDNQRWKILPWCKCAIDDSFPAVHTSFANRLLKSSTSVDDDCCLRLTQRRVDGWMETAEPAGLCNQERSRATYLII
jgi:hypothetical protein